MNKPKEKPKLGKAKEKSQSALLPRQAVHMMKEKYIKEMDQRPKSAENSTQEAPDQVERAGRWAADELTGRAVEQGRRYVKKKFTAHGEAQTDPEPVSNGTDSPAAENIPRGQPAPEYPSAPPVEHQEAERLPTAPKERPQGDHTTAPVKERRTAERRTTVQEQPRPCRPAQTTAQSDRPYPRTQRDTYPLKERPTTQPVKERPAVDLPRAAARDTIPRTADRQPTVAPVKRSEAVPPRFRPQQALKGQNILSTPQTTDRITPQAVAPKAATGQAPATQGRRSEVGQPKARQQRTPKQRPQLSLRGRGISMPTAAPVTGLSPDPGPAPGPGQKAPQPAEATLTPKMHRGVVKAPAKPAARSTAPAARAAKAAHRQMQRRIFIQAVKPAKNIGAVFRRAVQAAAKAVSAVTGAVSAIVGGSVLLVALVIVIVIAA